MTPPLVVMVTPTPKNAPTLAYVVPDKPTPVGRVSAAPGMGIQVGVAPILTDWAAKVFAGLMLSTAATDKLKGLAHQLKLIVTVTW